MLAVAPAVQAAKWSSLTSARWEIYTDSGEKTGAQVLKHLTAMQDFYQAQAAGIGARTPTATPPVRVILFRAARDFQPFQRGASNRGLFQSGPALDYIILSESGEDTLRAARHELVHLTFAHSASPMPHWLEEGLAEYFSTAQRVGDKIVLGKPVAAHLQVLASGSWMDPLQLLAVRDEATLYNDSRATGVFYAQSWALTHWLMQMPDARAALQRFLDLMRQGAGQRDAFEQAFGRKAEDAMQEVRAAVSAHRFPETGLPASGSEAPLSAAREVKEPEILVVRSDALMANGKLQQAEELLQNAARRWPNDPGVAAGSGYLAMRRSDYTMARQELERAIALGDRQAATRFEYAMLIRDTHGPEALVTQSLRQAVELNPAFAEAWFLLGTTLLRQGNATGAEECIARATEILPRQSVFWEALGRAQLEAGKRVVARVSALRALDAASTPEQASIAQGLLRDVDTPAPAKPSTKPGVTTPKGWESPKGDSTASGRLVFLDCATSLLKFHIETKPAAGRTPAQKVIVGTERPNQVMLRGGSAQKREFICGPQPGSPLVEAGYIAKAQEPPPPPAPKPVPPAKASSTKKGATPKKAAPAKPVKPADPPVAGELVWLEFK